MCGIVGYIGNKDAYPILIKGLKRLEYRGYDSAGVAIIDKNNNINIYKQRGKVSHLESYTTNRDTKGNIGIAHTRWATHGEPNQNNSHPHCSQSGNLAIIHNGIIENYAILKKDLINKGYKFKSDTDSEVLIQLIEQIQLSIDIDILSAVQLALHQIVGAYAIAIIDKNSPDQIIVARKSSPLVVGIGDGEYFIGSDATPIIEHTDKVIYLNDNEIAVIAHNKKLKIVDIENTKISHQVQNIQLELANIEKGSYPHFMLKEIYEQPQRLRDSMRGRINIEQNQISLASIIENKAKFINASRFIIVACGTSWHAALIGKQLIETFCGIPVDVEYASEFRYRKPVIKRSDIIITISQSGETADTIAAVELAKLKGAFVYGICNAVGSTIARMTDTGTYTHVGPEIGVASTKAFTGQVTVLILLALSIGHSQGTISDSNLLNLIKELQTIPNKIEEILELNDRIKLLSHMFTYADNFIYLGRGYNFPVALEGALKLKEVSYIHAEGYPAAEMKHGPIALVGNQMPICVIATQNNMYEKVLTNIEELKARGGKILAIATKGDKQIAAIADEVLEIPSTLECYEPLLTTIPMQLISYHIAVCKGKDVDQPRNLAKSVTVE